MIPVRVQFLSSEALTHGKFVVPLLQVTQLSSRVLLSGGVDVSPEG